MVRVTCRSVPIRFSLQFVVAKNAAGFYTISSINSLDPVAVPGSSTKAGTKLQQATPSTGTNQQWSFKAA